MKSEYRIHMRGGKTVETNNDYVYNNLHRAKEKGIVRIPVLTGGNLKVVTLMVCINMEAVDFVEKISMEE